MAIRQTLLERTQEAEMTPEQHRQIVQLLTELNDYQRTANELFRRAIVISSCFLLVLVGLLVINKVVTLLLA
jgi:hypothetical protein